MHAHIAQVNEIAQTSTKGAASIARFALLTIRTQFETVPAQVADYLNHGNSSRFVWGNKRTAFHWLDQHADMLQACATEAATSSPVDLVDVFLDVPGLGLAKAGFCAQMFADQVGCLDYLNEKLYGVTVTKLKKSSIRRESTRRRHVAAYVDLCASIGTSAELWSRWCGEVGKRKNWPNGDAVSKTHVNLISALARAASA